MDPTTNALLFERAQTSRARSGVSCAFSGRLSDFKRGSDLVGDKDVEKGRLLEIFAESPCQSYIEDRVAGVIDKAGEDNGVVVRELQAMAPYPNSTTTRQQQ